MKKIDQQTVANNLLSHATNCPHERRMQIVFECRNEIRVGILAMWPLCNSLTLTVCACLEAVAAASVSASRHCIQKFSDTHAVCGPGSVVGIATGYGLDDPGIESRWRRDFPHLSNRPWGPPSLLYSGYRIFPGGKAIGEWRSPSTLI